jgi:drug/metabolite transporter (DMT)-like permease
MTKINSNVKGISFLILAMLIISFQSIAVKWVGGSYPVLEMVVLRNLVVLPFPLLFFRYEGKRGLIR